MKSMDNIRSRKYCFTINNFTDTDVQKILDISECKLNYLIVGEEIGESGTPHLQGYIHWKNAILFKSMKKMFPRAHYELTKGTDNENKVYCSKDKKLIREVGEPSGGQGKRTDLEEIKHRILSGENLAEVVTEGCNNYQQLRYAEGLVKYRKIDKEYKKKKVYWYHGDTGTGKTKAAMLNCGKNDIWISGKDLMWFDGYWGQKCVIIDDFRGDFCTFHFLLRLLDGYDMMVPVKGGFVKWEPEEIYITSSYSPRKVFKVRENIEQLIRRISYTEYFINKTQNTEVGGNTKPRLYDDIVERETRWSEW